METGYHSSPINYGGEVILTAFEPDNSTLTYQERLYFHSYQYAQTWSYNSDHLTLPVTSTRSIHVEVAPDVTDGLLTRTIINIKVTAYRM